MSLYPLEEAGRAARSLQVRPRVLRWQMHRFWRAWNALCDLLAVNRRCRICGGDRSRSEWHARIRPTPNGPDLLCFSCWARYAGSDSSAGRKACKS